jgi:hypothetical protein
MNKLKWGKILLICNGIMFIFFGLIFLIDPVRFSDVLFLKLVNEVAKVEVTAMYGGLNLSLGGFFLYCGLRQEFMKAGLLASGLILLGMGLSRTAAILGYGNAGQMMIFFAFVELIWGSLFIYLFKSHDKCSELT